MSGERRTFQVYEAALALAGSERQAFLERECGSDLELRRAVDSLLRSADSAASDGFLDKPVAGNIKALGAVSHRHAPGDRIDRYQLQQVIGEGGFGTVYLALQTEPVQRKVALKLIRSDHVDNSFVRRFDSERQALALLNHPGIAQIYDAGTTPDGDPFFVMEYVDGSSITEYCDQRQLTIEERLALFQQVCAAVQHAHQKGVIHRDIKPSNVLVAESDDGPTPKVIDFGIAKATDLSIDQETLATAGGILGSPAYMSPEQLDPSVGEADTRTDVYGLGMLLYQLLAGANPFSQGSPSIVDLIRSVVEKDALRPSRLVRDLGDSDAAVDRQLHTEDLARRLESDLDWIVIRSLDKDRDRRYESPAALAADIERVIAHEPILARPPSTIYQVAKFVRRHRLGVAAAAMVVFSLVAGIVGTTLGLLQARGEADRAAKAELKATQEAESARQTVELLQEFLGSADPSAQGRDLTVVELLQAFDSRLDAMDDRPRIKSRLLGTYGATYRGLGLYGEAVTYARQSLELLKREQGEAHPDTLAAMNLLGQILVEQGQYDEARDIHETVLKRAAELNNPELELTYQVSLAEVLTKQGNYDRAEILHREAMRSRQELLGEAHDHTLHSMNRLALTLWAQGNSEEAETLSRTALDLRQRHFGEDHPSTLSAMSELALVVADAGRWEEGGQLHGEVAARRSRILGPEHRKTLVARTNLAWVRGRQGEFAVAEEMLREVFEIQRRTLGPDHPDTLATLANLSSALVQLGRLDEAEALAGQTYRGRASVLGENHPQTLVAMGDLIVVYSRQRKYEQAAEMGRSLLARNREARGPEHPATVTTQQNLGWALGRLDQLDEAEELLRGAVEIRGRILGQEHPRTLTSTLHLATVLRQQDNYHEALDLTTRGMAASRRVRGPGHPGTLRFLQASAELHALVSEFDKAAALYRELLEGLDAQVGAEHPRFIKTRESLIQVLRDAGMHDDAEELSQSATPT